MDLLDSSVDGKEPCQTEKKNSHFTHGTGSHLHAIPPSDLGATATVLPPASVSVVSELAVYLEVLSVPADLVDVGQRAAVVRTLTAGQAELLGLKLQR